MSQYHSYPTRAYRLAGLACLAWMVPLFIAFYSAGSDTREALVFSLLIGAIFFLIYTGRIFGAKLQISDNILTYHRLLRRQTIDLDKIVSCQFKLRDRGFTNPAYWVCHLEDSQQSVNFPANVWRNNDELKNILKAAAARPGVLVNDNAKSQLKMITTL